MTVTKTKAYVAAIGAAITAAASQATLLVAEGSDTAKIIAIVVGVVGVISTFFATFQIPNVPKDTPVG